MNQKEKKWVLGLIFAIILFIGCLGGYAAGKNAAGAQFQAEREIDILLNKSELEGLGEIDGPIYVTGHKSPDADAVGSAIGCAALFRQLGYDTRPVVLGNINNETQYILESAGLETPELLENAAGCNMILVDHSEYTQSAAGLEDAHIVAIFDHHNDGAVTTGNQIIYDERPLGSASTIVWSHYRNYGLEPDRKTALAMLGGVLSDTRNLESSSATFADREAVKELSGIAGISDTDTFFQEMYKRSLSFEGMTDEEIFFHDYKQYESAEYDYSIGCISVYDEDGAKDMAERMKTILPAGVASDGMDFGYAQISIYHDDLNITYLVPSDETAAGVIEDAFGDDAKFDGTSYVITPGISRKTVLVPAITNVLEQDVQMAA